MTDKLHNKGILGLDHDTDEWHQVSVDDEGKLNVNSDVGVLANQTLDYDTGGGTEETVIVGIALPASGGPVAGGTTANPIRTDPTGTTAQPVTDNNGSLTVDGTFFQATQPISAAALPLPLGAATSALQTQPGVDVGDVTINNATGASAVNIQDGGNSITVDGTVTASNVSGNIAHDGVDSGNPLKIGSRAVSYGTNPTGVSSADRADQLSNVAGIPFVMVGHPNIISRRDNYTSAQTDTKLITVSAGTKIVVVSCTIAADAAGTTKPLVRAGFAATTTPTGAGVYISHPGLAAGSGIAERIPVAGADGDDFIFTCAVPTGGSIDVVTKYFTIES